MNSHVLFELAVIYESILQPTQPILFFFFSVLFLPWKGNLPEFFSLCCFFLLLSLHILNGGDKISRPRLFRGELPEVRGCSWGGMRLENCKAYAPAFFSCRGNHTLLFLSTDISFSFSPFVNRDYFSK